MSVTVLNDANTSDTYVDALTVVAPMSGATILVYGQPVFYEEGRGQPYPTFGPNEHKLPNGVTATIDHDLDGLRLRSAISGQPATVTVIPVFRT